MGIKLLEELNHTFVCSYEFKFTILNYMYQRKIGKMLQNQWWLDHVCLVWSIGYSQGPDVLGHCLLDNCIVTGRGGHLGMWYCIFKDPPINTITHCSHSFNSYKKYFNIFRGCNVNVKMIIKGTFQAQTQSYMGVRSRNLRLDLCSVCVILCKGFNFLNILILICHSGIPLCV